jgi:hypothetical protein
MARQSVSKHLDILEAANLVTTLRRGREKLHYLNAAPINEIAERWITRYERDRVHALADLKRALEDTAMDTPSFVYTTYIKTTPERLWQALTAEPDTVHLPARCRQWAQPPVFLHQAAEAHLRSLALLEALRVRAAELSLLVHGAWRDPEGFNFPQTKMFEDAAILPILSRGIPAAVKRPHFSDIAPRSSINYISNNNFTGRKYFQQPMCGGVEVSIGQQSHFSPWLAGAMWRALC